MTPTTTESTSHDPAPRVPSTLIRGWLILAGSVAPSLAAIWTASWFITQDGPAHAYNARILAWSFTDHSPYAGIFEVHWDPIPNWTGHLALAGLISVLPAWVADRIMTSVTFVGFAASVFWLRTRVAGSNGLGLAAITSTLIALNFSWFLGFTSFMLGACLFPITLGVWWSGRERLSSGRLLALAVLLSVGYFCHLVSLGLTVIGLVVLAWFAPFEGDQAGIGARIGRLARTSLALAPLTVLGVYYVRLSRAGGAMRPEWEHLQPPWSPAAWVAQLSSVDPISLAIKDGLPLTDQVAKVYSLLAPVVWFSVALMLWWFHRITQTGPRAQDRAGWLMLATLLIAGGMLAPDSLGAAHGQFLPQRVLLLGLAALVPALDVDPRRWSGRLAITAMAGALAIQSVVIWDYARYCDQTAGPIIAAGERLGQGQRLATVLASSRGRFRSNPLLHAECWLGVDRVNVVWNNYETVYYYFPVQFCTGMDRPTPSDLEKVSILEGAENAAERRRRWQSMLEHHADVIDVVLSWKKDPVLDDVTERSYRLEEDRGDVRIFRRRAAP